MRKTMTLGLALAIASATFFSCKKKDENTPTPTPTTKDRLVGKWKSSFEAEDDNGNNTLDASERMALTSDLEYLTINSDGTFRDSVTGTLSGVFTGTWSLESNDQYLKITIPGFGANSGKLYQIDADNLIMQDTSASPASWSGYVHF